MVNPSIPIAKRVLTVDVIIFGHGIIWKLFVGENVDHKSTKKLSFQYFVNLIIIQSYFQEKQIQMTNYLEQILVQNGKKTCSNIVWTPP